MQFGESEFAFGKCGMKEKGAILRNRFNQTAAARSRNITNRLKTSLNMTDPVRPLGIYLLIFDSVSRKHFYRNFPKTIRFLNSFMNSSDEYSIFDFAVNNANGENTPPNMISMLYGFDVKRIKKLLEENPNHGSLLLELQENALWKVFEQQGFVTLFGFDTIWDYLTPYTGRVIATDHMIANFFHAAKRAFGYNEFATGSRCIGNQNAHYYPLNYLVDYNNNYQGYNRFGYIHLSPGHEPTGNAIRTADEDLKNMLLKMLTDQRDRQDEDFVLMIGADHGLHVGEWDKIYEGFIENQLPLHLLITNNKLLQRLGPDTHRNLLHSSKRLVTRYDWNLSFKHLSTVPYGKLWKESPLYASWKGKSETPNALSLFLEAVPDSRSCFDMNIPMYYCTCLQFQEQPIANARDKFPVQEIATEAIKMINSHINLTGASDLCKSLTVKTIQQVLIQDLDDKGSRHYKLRLAINEQKDAIFDVIGFIADPEEFSKMNISENSSSQPVVSLMNGSEVRKLQVKFRQIKEVIRADNYAGVCEQLAKLFGTRPALCICSFPFPDDSPLSPKLTTVVENILNKLTLYVPLKGIRCKSACESVGKGCIEWASILLNDQRFLTQPWKSESSLNISLSEEATERKWADLNIVSWERRGTGVRLERDLRSQGTEAWDVLLAEWTQVPNCATNSVRYRQICPCY